ncbi:MAG TPA: serine/threonine-protein kinase [Polyangiaceae bacterium]|nr:serine/threonine-protein kinase [Polyangiaceae bacterium]
MSHKPTNYTGPVWPAGTVLRRQRLRILGVLGQGGMAIVYEAEHIDTRQGYALKVLSSHLSNRSDVVVRFFQEARVLAALRRAPHIITLYEASLFEDNQPYLLLELLRGRTLREVLNQGRVPIALGCRYVQQLLWALAIVHHAKLVHRDVKPENIFVLDDGTCKLLDFGIVKVALESPVSRDFVTGPGGVMGTSFYMAPEHQLGKTPDARADVYAAGVVLFELLLGTRPFPHRSDGELQARILKRGFPSLEETGGFDVPAELRAVVRRATHRSPDDRYQDVAEFAADLNRVLQLLGLLWDHGVPPLPPRGPHAASAPAPPPAPTLDELPSLIPPSERRTRDVSRSLVVPPGAYPSPPDGPGPAAPSPPVVAAAPAAGPAAPSAGPASPEKAASASAPGSDHPPLHLARSSTPARWRSPTPPRRSLVKALVPRLEDFIARMFDMLTPVQKARKEKLAKVYALEAHEARRVGEAPPNSQRPVASPVIQPIGTGVGRKTGLVVVLGAFGFAVATFAILRAQESRLRDVRDAMHASERNVPGALPPGLAARSAVRPPTSAVPPASATAHQATSRPATSPPSPPPEAASASVVRALPEAAARGNAPPASSTARGSEARQAPPKGASSAPLVLPKRRLSLPK